MTDFSVVNYHRIQLIPKKVLSSAAVSHLIGGVLPYLSDHRPVVLGFLYSGPQCFEKFVGQFVGHIETKAGCPAAQPVSDDGIFRTNDII